MSKGLDMSLDDIIKSNKSSGSGNSRGRGGSRGGGGFASGPARRFPNRAVNRAAPYAVARAPVMNLQQHGMFPDLGAGQASALETGTKLYISNLDYGVSNEDIKELFAEVGDLKRYSIHYDKSGRSKGTAEVIFSRRADAMAAVKRYDNVQLDGKPMKIEMVGTNFSAPGAPVMPVVGAFGISNGSFGIPNGVPRGNGGRGGAFGRLRGSQSRGGGRGRGFGRGGGGGGRGGGERRGRGEKLSADDLDADLEKYHTEAMQTN